MKFRLKNWTCRCGLIALCLLAASVAQGECRRGYADSRFGQVHYHICAPAVTTASPTPIVFFHQNPKSGDEYKFLLKEMGRDRTAIAFDTPGYGESDRPSGPPMMSDLAGAMADALVTLGYGEDQSGPVDVFGFHTGAFIAAELALSRPNLVRRVVLSGVAFRSEAERQALLDALPRDYELPEDGRRILDRWALIVVNRAEGVSFRRATKVFLEDIHSLDKWWYAYNAVWSYPVEKKLRKLTHPVKIIQPHELLLEETRKVHRELLPNAAYIEIPEVVDDVFDTGWRQYALELRNWLDNSVE
ncbi:alpha/beta fold hydrolase [Lentisalinibacter orientalis]|uniref:alpha/beta fold hydrolase n=1 Tax=Lentisalinibacter orientalis TaxID=2992241 RepID=UPI003867D41A